jgi:FkbM family methyltransferase
LKDELYKEITAITHHLNAAGINVDQSGKIIFPEWCKSLKIDVGLSSTAKMSFEWLNRQQDDLIIFAFEPVLSNIQKIQSQILNHKDPNWLKQRLILLPLALGEQYGIRNFYLTQDTAQSSLLVPKKAELSSIEAVEVVTLEAFMSLVPKNAFPLVDHLKTDCQGTDLDVILGAGDSVVRFVCITAEAETANYKNSRNNLKGIRQQLETFGFDQINSRHLTRILIGDFIKRFSWLHKLYLLLRKTPLHNQKVNRFGITFEVEDPTFVNTKVDLPPRQIYIYQNG